MTPSTDTTYHPLAAHRVDALKFIVTTMAVDFALYGVQITLSIAAIFILLRRHARGSSYFTLAAILGLLLSSTISTVANEVFYVIEIPPYLGTSKRGIELLLFRLSIVITVVQDVNFVISDAVLVWRAWRLWPYNRFVRMILLLCVSGTVVGSIVECSWDFWRGLSTLGRLERNAQFLPRFIPLLLTNIVATALIGVKISQYRRDIKGALGLLTQKTQTEAIIMLLLESGVAYVLFWVAGCVVQTVAVHDQFSSVRVFSGTYHHIAGIYPTCILFVAIRDTTDSLLTSQVSQAMRFAGPPAADEGEEEAGATINPHSE